MINVNNLSKSFGAKILFQDISTTFSPGNRYGLTGPNGAGKSTFFKILMGDEEATAGSVNVPRRIGILRQDQFRYDEIRIIDTVLMGNEFLWAALEERERLEAEDELTDEMGMRLGELEIIIAEENGYIAEAQAAKLLEGIGIPKEKHCNQMKTLPTDLRFRVLLAQALFGEPEALLLDEPTNYLDMQSIQWLEENLKEYRGTLLVISHDRHFLNAVCTHIADIDYETVIIYPGNYDDMVVNKVQARERIEAENLQKSKKVAQLQEFVARFGAGTRSSQTQSRLKEIERLESAELKKSNIQRPYIRFNIKRASGKEALRVENISKSYIQPDGNILDVIKDFSLSVSRGDKIGVIGNNGLGKTTLLRMLVGELAPDSGLITNGYETSFGYFPQDYKQTITQGMTAFEWLEKMIDDNNNSEIIRSYLGRMLFSGDDAFKQTEQLSGGEGARLILAKLMMKQDNLLVLDEPTNHLDLEAVSALSNALVEFSGTAIFVSHDRDLITKAATRIISFTGETIDVFSGNYEEYLFSKKSQKIQIEKTEKEKLITNKKKNKK